MSRHDEFHDLKEQLRQNRPATEPMPPAFKRRLRAHLVEQQMNPTTRYIVTPLRLAFGALVLLLVPFLFWLWQTGLVNDGSNPAVSAPAQLEPAAIEVTRPVVEEAKDSVEIVTAYPQPQTALNTERPTVTIMVAYELNTADEAELILRLNQSSDSQSGLGLVSASQVVTRGRGVVVMPLTIDSAELIDETISLNVLLRDTSAAAERLLFLDFPGDYQWRYQGQAGALALNQPEAVILGTGPAVAYPEDQPAAEASAYQLEMYVAYNLGAYDQGYLSLGYEYDGPRGGSSAGHSLWISSEESFATIPLMVEPELLYQDGTFRDEVEFSLELFGLDTDSGENVIIFPQESVEAQLEIPEKLEIQSVALVEDELGRPALQVMLWYERRVAQESILHVAVEAQPDPPLAEVELPVGRQRDSVTALLPVDLTAFPGDFLLRIAATLETTEQELQAQYPLQVGGLLTPRVDEVWLIVAETITETVPVEAMPGGGFPYRLNVIAGYSLSDAYEHGVLTVMSEQHASGSGGGGGGGGGGSSIVEPGVGSFNFAMPLNEFIALEPGQERPAGFKLTIELRGVLADGTEKLLSTWSWPDGP